ncbi:MAG TPA: hypothetical protein VN894_20445 [Polyangiaceae bacterium]|nr:hypothetical protein [Polyangiaceae bacterium]
MPLEAHARRFAPLAVALAVSPWCSTARADDANQPATPGGRTSAERPAAEPAPAPLRVGAIGGVGFPQPLAVEGIVVLGGVVALGVEYGSLPSTTISGVQASLWSLSGDARVFPFGGAFFVGLRAGHQQVAASTRIVVGSIISVSEALTIDSWFLNPRLGFLWTSRAGLGFGVDAGVEVPMSTTISSTLPLALLPPAQNTVDAIANAVVPTVDILRIGLIL